MLGPGASAPDAPATAPKAARILPFPERGSAEAAPPHATVIPPGDSIRWTRVRAARARMASEFYDRPLVRERIADALLLEILSP